MTVAPDPMVDVRGLSRKYGDLVAARDVSFTVARGEMFGLIGPDGAGKTTTLRTILGLLEPDGGTVRTCGLDPWRETAALSRRVGYLSQRFSLYGDLTVDENVAFFADIHGVSDRGESNWRDRRDRLLDMLRMTPFRNRRADRLSGGMKQKLALCCTLIHTPELLILDEPTTGVDPVSRRDFWKILSRLQREGLTLLVTTPYLDEAERCQRIALMDHGRLLTESAPGLLRDAARGTIVEVLAAPKRAALDALRSEPHVEEVEAFGERLHATLPDLDPSRADDWCRGLEGRLRDRGLAVESIRPVPPSLEDVFIARLRAAEAARSREGAAA